MNSFPGKALASLKMSINILCTLSLFFKENLILNIRLLKQISKFIPSNLEA